MQDTPPANALERARGDPGSVAVETEEHTSIEFVINDSGCMGGD